MKTSIKEKKAKEKGIPREEEKSCKGEKREGYNAPRTLSEDLNPATRTNGRLS